MNAIIRKNGADLVIETTLIDPNTGSGIPAGLTVTASIQRMSDGLYWSSTPAFDSVPEGALKVLTHQNNGLYAFTLIGGAESVLRSYRMHLVVTGNVLVNTNATFSDVILAKSDATLANQTSILANQVTLQSEHVAIGAQNVAIDAKTTNLPADPASETTVNLVLSTGGIGPWTNPGAVPVTLDDSPANRLVIDKMWDALRSAHLINGSFGEYVLSNLIKWNGNSTIDGKSLTLFAEILLSYTNGRFKINWPNPGDITFYRQDNTTALFVMHINTEERTRL